MSSDQRAGASPAARPDDVAVGPGTAGGDPRRRGPLAAALGGLRSRRRPTPLGASTTVAVLCTALALALPAPFVAESPGPTFNTVGTVDGHRLITVDGRASYPTTGNLDLTTVYVNGGPNGALNAVDALGAWLDPTRSVVPTELLYPPDVTAEQVEQSNSAAMTSSQQEAVAAALAHEKIAFDRTLTVANVVDGTPAAGRLRDGDVLETVGGRAVTGIEDVRSAVAAAAGSPVALRVRNDGATRTERVTPAQGEGGTWQLGVQLAATYRFPFSVTIALDNVGGPSAGMMFALGIIDTITPGALAGGRHIAGTGTISADGTVGAIGGIAQKMEGAQDAGAQLFLAPGANCSDVVGHVPDGLRVVRVDTLAGAVRAVETAAAGGDLGALPRCG
ncbi:YlbL family protein [Tersicoccus solisilvae]|uniref:YlbL family protein n=1 Tax=Tersicoccus solisilvae TaxID=1882339 RepID=UPI001E47F60F|nr:PDZ domain-containing protein [Tersicoccus solisilvae]